MALTKSLYLARDCFVKCISCLKSKRIQTVERSLQNLKLMGYMLLQTVQHFYLFLIDMRKLKQFLFK